MASYTRSESFTTPGAGSWTIPDGITSVSIEVWGAGGCGGYANAGTFYPGPTTLIIAPNSTVSVPNIGTLTAFGGYSGRGSSNRIDAVPFGGSGSGPGGSIILQGTNGVVNGTTVANPAYSTGGKGGGNTGGKGGNWLTGSAQVPGGGGGGYARESGDSGNQAATSGGGGGYVQYTATVTPGTIISYSIGAGVTNIRDSRSNGANGSVTFSYTVTPEVVPTGYDVIPGKPTGPIGMDMVWKAFLGVGDVLPSKPIDIGSYYARTIAANRGSYTVDDPLARTLRYGYGIQKSPLYTQSVPNAPRSTPISLGDFKGTYQQLSMRAPIFLRADIDGTDPPYQTFAQYDCVQYWYTGAPQTFNFYNASVIMIECWGAYGRHYSSSGSIYTDGGYACGVYVAPAGGSLYVYVGGTPERVTSSSSFIAGGWNGGGYGWQQFVSADYRGGGGGATDVRTQYISTVEPTAIITTSTASFNSGYWGPDGTASGSLAKRIIVAGGGGGGYFDSTLRGGYGGGATGGTFGTYPGGAGTNSSGGLASTQPGFAQGFSGGFGYGGGSFGDATNNPYEVSGGGGGWYGGGPGLSGGGGSGYVGGMLPDTATGSRNFGITTVNAGPNDAGYVANGLAPNGLVNIFILG